MKRYIIYKFVAVVLSAIIYASCGDDKYPENVVASTSPFVCFEVSVQNEVYKEGSEANIYVPSSASTLNINVRSIYSWGTSVWGYKSWVSVSTNQGSGNSNFTLNIEENPLSEVRSETVRVHCDGRSISINIHQEAQGGANKTFNVNGVSFKMIMVQGGTFQMGATSEQVGEWSQALPIHNVTLSSYSIGETEVTQALWKAVMGKNPSKYTGNEYRPVECVSWNDCQDFIQKLNTLTGKNFRLPTEAEWEYAARGGNKSASYIYSGSNDFDKVAWFSENSEDTTHPVKNKQANELGIYDMSGNVNEVVYDWYNSYSSSSQTNPTGPSSGTHRTERGGCFTWHSSSFGVSYRQSIDPTKGFRNVGFRLAL